MFTPEWNSLFFNTIQKEIRSRTLLVMFVITILIMFFVNAGLDLIIENFEGKNVIDLTSQKVVVFYFIISSWTVLLSVLFGIDCIKSDIEGQVIPLLLSGPIARWQFLVARLSGAFLIVFSYYVISFTMAIIFFKISGNPLAPISNMLAALGATGVVILGVITLAAFISIFSNKLVAFIISMIAYLVMATANTYLAGSGISQMFQNFGLFKGISLVFYWLLPHLGLWNSMSTNLIMGKEIELSLFPELLHFGVSFTLLFAVFALAFKKQEF